MPRSVLLQRVLTLLHQGALASGLILFPMLLRHATSGGEWLDELAAGGLALTSLTWIADLFVLFAARRMQAGTRGRARLISGAIVNLLLQVVVLLPVALLVYGTHSALEAGFLFSYGLDEPYLALDGNLRLALWIGLGLSGAALLVDWGLTVGAWFLLPPRVRFVTWVLVDLALVALVFLVRDLPAEPVGGDDLEHLKEPVLRLTVIVFFCVRLFIRSLPLLLDLVEYLRFQALVASRHLRAKKSGFLAMISGLSIAAVALSCCMLVTVLSVMGGFRNDLKEKILGNHAHVVIDRAGEKTFEGWLPTLERARATPGVVAATPYVSGEVMVTSTSNQAGIVLRGIDPETIGDVTELENNLRSGRMEYLVDPERLLHLPPEERRSILPMELFPNRANDDPGLIREIEQELERDEPPVREEPRRDEARPLLRPEDEHEDEPAGDPLAELDLPSRNEDVLPGIIVGKELARTLRLFVGDDIDVISPSGELGPTGPMPKSRRFRVAGVFYSGMYEYDMKLAYVTLADGQRFLSTGDAISGIEIKVDDVERAKRVAQTVATSIERPDLQVRDWQELNRNLFGALALEKLAMFITLGIAILIAGFCVFGTLTLMVQEKGREVAILQAVGATARSIVEVFLLEGLFIGLFGALIGVGLGYVVTFVFSHFGFRLNPEVYYIDRLPVHIDPVEFTIVGISAVVVCLLATIFPALIASRMRPIDALRYQ